MRNKKMLDFVFCLSYARLMTENEPTIAEQMAFPSADFQRLTKRDEDLAMNDFSRPESLPAGPYDLVAYR
jgi:hypothetical protein